MRFNKLSLNYSETSHSHIGPSGKRLHDFTVKIIIYYIPNKPTKHLGVYIDDILLGQATLPTLRKLPRVV